MKFQEGGIKCPKCGKYLSLIGEYKPNFCPECGQHLAWDGIDQWKEI